MTRETKIGLLVGLAFIVVFAMLLSHSGQTTPPGDLQQLAKARQDLVKPRVSDRVEPAPLPQPAVVPVSENSAAASPAPREVDQPQATPASGVASLPTPGILGPPVPSVPIAENLNPAPTEMAAAEPGHDMLEGRVAPPLPPEPVAAPEPTARTASPEQTPDPAAEPANPTPAPAAEPAAPPSIVPAPSKDYVVQKGETLNQICKAMYGSASNRVVEFFMKANHMKNKHMVVEGQKLTVPQLPPEMFEPVVALNVGHPDSNRIAKVADMLNGGTTRRAPVAPVTEAEKTTTETATSEKTSSEKTTLDKLAAEGMSGEKKTVEKSSSEKTLTEKTTKSTNSTQSVKSSETRTYEVKSNETFVSIAKSQLGSGTAWKEIQKLNKGVDPTKMKPGMKIKIPSKRPPVSQAAASERNSV